MRQELRAAARLVLLVPALASAQSSPPPDHGAFVGPAIGANVLTLEWDRSDPYAPAVGYVPSVRLGLFLPKLFLNGEAGLALSGAPFGGSFTGTLRLGGDVGTWLWTQGNTRAYGFGGLGLGTVLNVNPSFFGPYPVGDVTVGAGWQYFLTPDASIGAEAGARTHFVLGGRDVEVSTSIFIAVTGTIGTGTRPREQGPGTTSTGTTTTGTGTPPGETVPGTALTPGEKPTFYGHSDWTCTTYATDGWFEPTQDVWQDDLSFDDKPTKQLTRTADVTYNAELHMVKNKDTLLFGVHHYRKDGQQVIVDSRDFIVLKGMTNCTKPIPVKFKFTQRSVGSSRVLYTSDVIAQVPLEGAPTSQYHPWEARLAVRDGIPEQPFKFDVDLPYQLKAELIRADGKETGLEMSVGGYVDADLGPTVHFIPVTISPFSGSEENTLVASAEMLADESAKKVPDVFPIPKGGLPTFTKVLRNFSDKDIGDKWLEFRRIDATVAAVNDSLASSAFLDGAGRVVAVMRGSDFRAIFGPGAAGMTVDSSVSLKPKGEAATKYKPTVTLSWKVMLMPHWEHWDTVAHELVHTLPDGWADDEMQKECGRNYHNKDDRLAHGEKITEDSEPAKRERKAGMISLMGPSVPISDVWMDQCTYWHLEEELAGGPPDPPVLLMRAIVGKQGAKVKGELKPVYNLMGHADLRAGKAGPFAFVFRDAKGAELARFPFTPRYNDLESKLPRTVISEVYRVPDVPNWAKVELVGPGGVLDQRTVTASPPSLEILSPADQAPVTPVNGKIHVTWKATAAAGTPLLYSVLYSPDGGKNWLDQVFELKETAFDVTLKPGAVAHQVKIVATDGSRSAAAIVRLGPLTPAQTPIPPPAPAPGQKKTP